MQSHCGASPNPIHSEANDFYMYIIPQPPWGKHVSICQYLPSVSAFARTSSHPSYPGSFSTLVAERGGSPVLPSTPLLLAGLPLPALLARPLPAAFPREGSRVAGTGRLPASFAGPLLAAAGLPPRAEPRPLQRAPAPAGAGLPTRGEPRLHSSWGHGGRRTAAPERKQREDPTCGKAKVGNPFPPNGG